MNIETVQEIQGRIGGMAHYDTVAINATELFELCEIARKALGLRARLLEYGKSHFAEVLDDWLACADYVFGESSGDSRT